MPPPGVGASLHTANPILFVLAKYQPLKYNPFCILTHFLIIGLENCPCKVPQPLPDCKASSFKQLGRLEQCEQSFLAQGNSHMHQFGVTEH